MATTKLSDVKIKSLKPKDKLYRLLDSDRLYIEIRPTGAKVWRFKFVFQGKESSMSLGEYPAISLAEARSLKDQMRAKLAKGIHPVEDRKNIRAQALAETTNTFDSIAAEFKLKRMCSKSETYQGKFDIALEKDISPVIGKKNINEVTSADVLKILDNTVERVVKESNGRFTGASAALENRRFVGGVIRYAIATLRAENDPTYAVRDVIKRPRVNHARALTKEERFKARTSLPKYNGTQTVKNAGFILLYTMLRAVEIRKMQWSWVDFESRLITFPIEVMKKARIHVLPISDQAYKVLRQQYEISGDSILVFPAIFSKKSSGMLSPSTLNSMLEYIGLKDVTTHDFRATASTLLYEKDYEEAWIEKQLAHAESNKTKASYNHSKHLKQRRKMMQDWADIVDSWKTEENINKKNKCV
ncbi:tyrosine-type recombinase/integrase [Acinetobacter venetianus]|uniref:tyrosine-type recombinase/integrase n=1 Tax=Acinetobacter venetianus TaxID=52133 RepID=UPI00077851A4|nr:integrase arm-type DNA-binding domain-containing protein [Acinetobacter venetianus]KXZ64810.1 putative prophage CPS-53 integrase [Acinetobacter venetianus]